MQMLKRIHAGCGEVAKVDVARAVQVSIRSIGTMGTLDDAAIHTLRMSCSCTLR